MLSLFLLFCGERTSPRDSSLEDPVPDSVRDHPAKDARGIPDSRRAPEETGAETTLDAVAVPENLDAEELKTVLDSQSVDLKGTAGDNQDGPEGPGCPGICPPGQECGEHVDECGNVLQCGSCEPPAVCGGEGQEYQCGVPVPLPYPDKNGYQLKGLQPDHWPDKDEIAGNGAGSVAMNMVWYGWEGEPKAPPCAETEQEFDDRCFAVSDGVDGEIEGYTERDVVVTAIVYGVPEWARQQVDCSPIAPGFEVFCKPDNPEDFARFAGMLAFRYNGLNGHGRIADFVIHNEVNSNDWFDIGCGQGTPCDPDLWISTYAANYNAAYDAIVKQQPHAKVLASFTHHFDVEFDQPDASSPLLSVRTFLTEFAALSGDRNWRVAYHPYPPSLLHPEFSADDLPRVTYGNIGVLVGWLQATFPETSSAADVQLTESGVNSLPPGSSPGEQADGVCRSLYNVVNTPGISNYIYHRMKDHPVEVAAGIGLGLVTEYGDFKPAWVTWALSNRIDLDPPQLSCGFENLPYTKLIRAYHSQRGHWASTRLFPEGFTEEKAYRLLREPGGGTIPLFECRAGDDNFVSKQVGCEGQQVMGPLGYIHVDPFDQAVPLYRCLANGDHMISPDPGCEGYETEHLLGYAQPWK